MTESTPKDGIHDVLKASLLKWLPGPSRLETAIKGLALSRYDEDISATRCFYTPMVLWSCRDSNAP